jgi:hypothetical protein
VGSANTVDVVTIAELLATPGVARRPVVIPDNDDAGEAMVAGLSAHFSLEIVTVPKAGQDVDDFIRDFGDNWKGAFEALATLIRERLIQYRPYAAVARQIYEERQYHGEGDLRREFEIHNAVKDLVVIDLADKGRFYHDQSQGYYFLEPEKSLVALDDSDRGASCLLERYGLNPSEKIHKFVMEGLFLEAIARGAETRVHRFAWYDAEKYTMYVFNHASQIYRVTEGQIELVDNGEDGVLFLKDHRNQSFELVSEEDLGDLFEVQVASQINFDPEAGRLTQEEERKLVCWWFLTLFFGSINPTRAILAFIGPKGSGKSYTLRRIGIILFGRDFEVKRVPSKEEDFDAITTNTHYAAFDNADTAVSWLPDRLATCATGGMVSKRLLYTTNTMVDYRVDCFVGITSRTPHFRRDDVADRLLPFQVKRFEGDGFVSEHELTDATVAQRNRIMTSVVRGIQEAIGALRRTAGRTYRSKFRLADFATFVLRLADDRGEREQAEDLLGRLAGDQSAFALGGDVLPDLLLRWLENKANHGREVTAASLYKELALIASKDNIDFPCKGGRSLGQYLTNMETNLQSIVRLRTDRDPTKHVKLYAFKPLSEGVKEEGGETAGAGCQGDSGAIPDDSGNDSAEASVV